MAYEYRGIEYLRQKLNRKRVRVLRRYNFYEMKVLVRDLGISTPPELRAWNSALGWCAHAVDDMADRLIFREMRNDVFGMNEIYFANNPDTLFDSSILSALIASCSFIRIFRAEGQTFPALEVIDGGNATGVIDDRTGLLEEGYAVLERNDFNQPTLEAWLRKEDTVYFENGRRTETVPHRAGRPLLVPVIFRPDAVRPFGHSRISRACMSYTEGAIRTIKRSEISAEFYSFPQKYVTGVAQDAEFADKWQAAMSAFIKFTVDDDGNDKVKFGQFEQASQAPHLEQLRMFASLFAGETALTLDDLGFPSENPSSQEAIKAAHENLRLKARKAQRTFGTGFLNAGFLAACLRDDYSYNRDAVAMTRPIWEPVFEPDASGLNLIGDGVLKLNQAVPDFITRETLRDLTGIQTDGSETT